MGLYKGEERVRACIGLDLGTSSIKAVAIDEEGTLLGHSSQSYPLHQPKAGWVEQRVEDWWAALKKALVDLMALPVIKTCQVVAVSVTG